MQTSIRNNTPNRLELAGADQQQIVLAPLELRKFEEEEVSAFDLSGASHDGVVTTRSEPPGKSFEILLGIGILCVILLAMACGIVAGEDTPASFGSRESWHLRVWFTGGIAFVVLMALATVIVTKSAHLVLRFLVQTLSLLVILAIGLGLPAATIYFFGGGQTLLNSPPSSQLFARLLQLCFIATASLLPALLFFLFDRYQISTLRDRLYRDLFRLDRSLKTRGEIDSKYGSEIREAYGPDDEGRGRLTPGTRWPVLVCAFVITMGWLAAFKPVSTMDPETIARPLLPEQTALTFGFLGAYFFGLQLIARRYARGDLKPKAYGYITIRILTVAVLSWVLEVIFPADSAILLATAFLIGVLPDEFFTLLKEWFRNRDRGTTANLVPESEKHPLTNLEGIDLYDRARLEQEGIVNVESFAHHDFIHLVLETQLPVARLVDWMDQAILYLHVIGEPANEQQKSTTRQRLREYGIRTTTDLLICWDAADKRSALPGKQQEFEDFKKLLGDAKPYRLEVIRDALLDDEWLDRTLDWRNDSDRDTLKPKAVPTTFLGMLTWAKDLVKKGRSKQAKETLLLAIEIGDSAEARILLARLFADEQDPQRYREHARKGFTQAQDNLFQLGELIDIFEEKGDIKDALLACDRAIEVIGDPSNDSERKNLTAMNGRRLKLVKKMPSPSI